MNHVYFIQFKAINNGINLSRSIRDRMAEMKVRQPSSLLATI